MTNKEVAVVLEEIAVLLELTGENPFKTRSYTNMARTISILEDDIAALVAEKRLREIKGLGEALEQKITELVTTGALKYHQDLRAKFPESLFELFGIPGLGAKRIKQVYDDLSIQSLAALEEACKEGRLGALKGFGPKMEKKILEGIAFAQEHSSLHYIQAATLEADRICAALAETKAVIRMDVAGSLRRRKEVVKDIDIIVSSDDPATIMDRFVGPEGVVRVTGQGETKASVVLSSGLAADLRVVSDEAFPYALAYFTGSKEHNVVMRQRAKQRGLKLNEYGLFDESDTNLPCADEAAIFDALDLPYIPPELREDRGEFEAETMPDLITMDDIVGVVHCHSTYSDGQNSLEQMALGAKERGYAYLGIADHSQTAAYAGGLKPAAVAKQHAEVDGLNDALEGVRILKGIESDIRSDGALDYHDDVLQSFDFVVASVHGQLNMTEAQATDRVIKAVENPYTTILGHPTGRLLLKREGYPLNWDAVFEACAAHRVAIEINAHPRRLDLDWRLVRRAKAKGVAISIGPDAHSVEGLDVMRYGLGIARKGWLEKADVLNTLTADQFLAWKNG
jgi:DNA polymerase (family 10)